MTWLLPARNAMRFLPEALSSIERQTYENWEILARDDGSSDKTLDELRRWIPSRLPGRIISGEPLGLGRSLAELTLLAKTELCARIDADDVSIETRLEKQVSFMDEHPEIHASGGQMTIMTANGEDKGPYFFLPLRHDDIVMSLLHFSPLAHPTVIFRRSEVLEAGNYRNVVAEDYDLWLRMAVRHRLGNLGDVLVRYRVHEDSYFQKMVSHNRSEGVAVDCLCDNASPLFGLAASEIARLRLRHHPLALLPMIRIARNITSRHGGSALKRVMSRSFSQALQAVVSPNDVISRLWCRVRRLA